MLQLAALAKPTLDRAKWHRPLISIIVTHHNYSDHITDALLSILDQTHENWECVVVDDGSDAGHVLAIEYIIAEIGNRNIRLLALEDNAGQIPAAFAGIDATSGEFVCLLDPDDRYAPTFLADMLAAHLNPVRFCPLVSCDQHLMRGVSVITGVQTAHAGKALGAYDAIDQQAPAIAPLRWFPPDLPGWHWSTTSSMMFRRPALLALRPHRPLGYNGQADAYLAPGAHMLGGSMFLAKSLIYRTVHAGNRWLREDVWGQTQAPKRESTGQQCRADAIEAINANGYGLDLARAQMGKRTVFKRLKRSIAKRWRRLTASK